MCDIQEERSQNSTLHEARREPDDEFYTPRATIESELRHYAKHFFGKSVLCNCDDPAKSEFFRYFQAKFAPLELKRLVGTHYTPSILFPDEGPAHKKVITPNSQGRRTPLKYNGDFRSAECVALMKEADIVCTNPPFSLLREYIAQLMAYKKKFLIIGNMNACSYKEVFPLIRENKIWMGVTNASERPFVKPDGTPKKLGFACWFTNLSHSRREKEKIPLYAKYSETPEKYPEYDNYPAIEVSKTAEIPDDYYGEMGVPISFLEKHNPNQFEIVDINPHFFTIVAAGGQKPPQLKLSGRKDPYARIIIKRKEAKNEN